jgi:hypothetical protein
MSVAPLLNAVVYEVLVLVPSKLPDMPPLHAPWSEEVSLHPRSIVLLADQYLLYDGGFEEYLLVRSIFGDMVIVMDGRRALGEGKGLRHFQVSDCLNVFSFMVTDWYTAVVAIGVTAGYGISCCRGILFHTLV